jgi:hypothetical protein
MAPELSFWLGALCGAALGAAARGWPKKRFIRVSLMVAATSGLGLLFIELEKWIGNVL